MNYLMTAKKIGLIDNNFFAAARYTRQYIAGLLIMAAPFLDCFSIIPV